MLDLLFVTRGFPVKRLVTLVVSLSAALSFAAEVCPATAKDPKHATGPCEKKPATACIEAGDALVATCRSVALERYQQACDRDALRGCSKLGFRLVENSRDVAVVKRAIGLFTKACDGGDVLGCSNLASFYWDGEGVAKDVKKSAQLSQKACDGGDAFACGTLGSLWAQGELGAKDIEKAAALFKRACDGGSASGCNQLGNATAAGLGVAKSLEQAMTLWTKACKGGNGAACTNAGRFLRKQGDDRTADKAFSRACKLGDDDGCKEKGLAPPDELP